MEGGAGTLNYLIDFRERERERANQPAREKERETLNMI